METIHNQIAVGTSKKQSRLLYIDRLRGLVMLTVVMIHLYNMAGSNSSQLMSQMSIIGNFRMPLFFFVSGYIICKVTRINGVSDLFVFFRKKAINLFLPTFTWLLVVTPLFFTRHPSFPDWPSIKGCLIDGDLWFLNTLFYFMLPIGFYKLFIHNKIAMGGVNVLY